MLLPPDADLAQRDPAVPGLATLLDPEALLALLRSRLPKARLLERAEIGYIRYKPGMNCLVFYRIEGTGETMQVHAMAYRLDAHDKLQKARRLSEAPGTLGAGCIVFEDSAIVLSVFPSDGRLKVLSRLMDPGQRKRLLQGLLPDRPELWEATLEGLRYKPKRRYVAQLSTAEGTQAVLKVYTKQDYKAARVGAKVFESRDALRIARRLGRSNRYHMVISEWLPGRLLGEATADSELSYEDVTAVGAALANLHAQNPGKLGYLTRQAEAAPLFALAADLGAISPRFAERFATLARRLAAYLTSEPLTNNAIHGDFYAKQVLVTDTGVAILDFDQAARGDPAADLGNFIAHLERDALRGNFSLGNVERLKEALLVGYRGTTRNSTPPRLSLYTAIGLLRLAPEPFRYHEPDWPARTEAILERVEALLEMFAAHTTQTPRGMRQQTEIPVSDPFDVLSDAEMPFLAQAVSSREVQSRLHRCLPALIGNNGAVRLCAIRVTRHKRGRRCLIEYDVEVERLNGPMEAVTVVGKARAKGLDRRGYQILESLWNAGFGSDSEDGISVPEPLGMIPEFHMCLQRKVTGAAATELLEEAGGVALAGRIAQAAHKLHQSTITPFRRHGMADELRILHERLPLVTRIKPQWKQRIERLLAACDRLAAATPQPRICGIHRDFYPDHVIVDGARLYLLDLDLYCEGDPGLDIGNFLGHMMEQSLRGSGNPGALTDRQAALEEGFVALSGEAARLSVQAYTTLTLVRHVYLSTQFPKRWPYTERLLELCEQRLSGATPHKDPVELSRFRTG